MFGLLEICRDLSLIKQDLEQLEGRVGLSGKQSEGITLTNILYIVRYLEKLANDK